MNYIKTLAMLLVVVFALSACTYDGIPYQVIKDESGCYIRLDVYTHPAAYKGSLPGYAYEYITFASFSEMQQDIRNGNFTAGEFESLLLFERNTKADIIITDPDELYEPVLPDDCTINLIYWYGDHYSVEFNHKEMGSLRIRLFDNIEEAYEGYNFNGRYHKTELNISGKTIHVIEHSSKDHDYISVIGQENGKVFNFGLSYYHKTEVTPELTPEFLEWISQFGVRKYVDTET